MINSIIIIKIIMEDINSIRFLVFNADIFLYSFAVLSFACSYNIVSFLHFHLNPKMVSELEVNLIYITYSRIHDMKDIHSDEEVILLTMKYRV